MSDDVPADESSKRPGMDFSGLRNENAFIKKLKRWLFRRGLMPEGDYSEMRERLRGRMHETTGPIKQMVPPAAATILSIGMSEEEEANYEARRRETNAKLRTESWNLFMKVFEEEAEAQWSRIVDRRVRDNFYSIFIGLIVGYLLGKFL